MEAHQEIAKLLRRLAELVEQMGDGIVIAPIQAMEDPPVNPQPAQQLPTGKWVNFVLQLAAPIGKPKAQRIIDRVAPSELAKRQIQVQMGPGSNGTKTFVVGFKVRCTDIHGDGLETAQHMADKINQRGADKRARAKVSRVLAVA